MHIRDLSGKSVCILGFGKEGQAAKRALETHTPSAGITVRDAKDGPDYLQGLQAFDILIKSPGIPVLPELKTHSAKLTTSTNIFFDSIAGSGAIVVGVTGSKGKSTTASLIHEMLKTQDSRLKTFLIGNIGNPALDYLDRADKGVIFVMELSSYQLMDLRVSPNIAVITSIFPEHLDYHGSFEAYVSAKMNIARFQRNDDIVIHPAALDVPGAGKHVPFSETDAPIAVTETKLLGHHNQSNIAAAWKTVEILGVSKEAAIAAAKAFTPLPHRLQSLGIHHGIEWIDDAISTTPDSTIAALDALGNRVQTIILGGTDRGVDFTALGERIAASRIKTVILFPGTGPRIKKAIERAKADVQFLEADSMEKAVRSAITSTNCKLQTPNSPIVLLSTASPSYNMFKNFEEKGEEFARWIHLQP